jgi:POT family proton-dependent oligopeptide transporter
LTQILIMSGALAAALALFYFHPGDIFVIAANVFTGVLLLIAGVVAWTALGRGGLPKAAGAPPDLERLRRPVIGILTAEHLVYLGTLVAIPVFTLLVSGLAVLRDDSRGVTLIGEEVIERFEESESPYVQIAGTVVKEISRPAGLALFASGLVAIVYLLTQTFRLDRVPRQRMYVVLILTFFSMLFWSFFEQAGSSLNNFADRNVDRVYEERSIAEADVGTTIKFRIPTEPSDAELKKLPILSQEQLGRVNENDGARSQIENAIRTVEEEKDKLTEEEVDKLVKAVLDEERFTMTSLTYLRDLSKRNKDSADAQVLEWKVAASNVGMGYGGSEVPASIFQAVNPLYIVVLGLVFSLAWALMAKHNLEPSTPVKFSMGLVQLGLGFGAFWWGSTLCDGDGMVALAWLFLGYLLHTTGELCLSPVGLGMVTRLSPTRLVSTVMGGWFLATAFSQFLAAIIAQFTGVEEGGGEGTSALPVPLETVHVYGGVFAVIAVCAIASGVICLIISPILKYWMHTDLEGKEQEA